MPAPRLRRAANRYETALAYHPFPGGDSKFASSMALMKQGRYFAGGADTGLEGLGDMWDDVKSIVGGAVGSVTATATAKVDRLERAITIILALSGIAAVTGVVNLVRGR